MKHALVPHGWLLSIILMVAILNVVVAATADSTATTEQDGLQPIRSKDIAGYHGTSLTHVFIPFKENQIDQVSELLQTWWTWYPPCLADDWDKLSKWRARSSGGDPFSVQFPIKLALVVGRLAEDEDAMTGIERDLAVKEKVLEQVKLCKPASACFNPEWSVCVVRFTKQQMEDARITDRLFYEFMLKGQCVRDRRGYALFMEPNTVPVQARWLTTLATAVSFPAPGGWVVGAAFRGNTTGIPAQNKPALYHMNRNSLVRLTNNLVYDEPEDAKKVQIEEQPRPIGPFSFAYFYFGQVRTWVNATKGPDAVSIHDQDVFEFLMQPNSWNIARGIVAHRVQFTNLILNIIGKSWDLASVFTQYGKETVLVHGGSLTGDGPAKVHSCEEFET